MSGKATEQAVSRENALYRQAAVSGFDQVFIAPEGNNSQETWKREITDIIPAVLTHTVPGYLSPHPQVCLCIERMGMLLLLCYTHCACESDDTERISYLRMLYNEEWPRALGVGVTASHFLCLAPKCPSLPGYFVHVAPDQLASKKRSLWFSKENDCNVM